MTIVSLFSDFDLITGPLVGFHRNCCTISEKSEKGNISVIVHLKENTSAVICLELFPRTDCTGDFDGEAIVAANLITIVTYK